MSSLYALTSQEFVNLVFESVGRGKRHALHFYKAKVRQRAIKEPEESSQGLMEEISRLVDCAVPPVVKIQEEGEVKKFLLRFSDGLESESVLIPMKGKTTLCVSSQVGCRMGCRFCQTGKMGRIRSLKAEEIIFQWLAAKSFGKIHNIVFMGMGEPLDNMEEVLKALAILTDPQGIGLSPSRITVSTSGLVDAMREFCRLMPRGIQLAVSVNASRDEVRSQIMPVNKKWNMADLYAAMREFNQSILIEYVMLNGVNDRVEDAYELAGYLRDLSCKVNLIPYNSQTKASFEASSEEQTALFAKALRSYGLQVLVRQSKGRGLMAACGQLGNPDLPRLLRKINSHSS
jgi:23S rRNA (adenine2503-C2)-methyltransferase